MSKRMGYHLTPCETGGIGLGTVALGIYALANAKEVGRAADQIVMIIVVVGLAVVAALIAGLSIAIYISARGHRERDRRTDERIAEIHQHAVDAARRRRGITSGPVLTRPQDHPVINGTVVRGLVPVNRKERA